MSNTYQIWRDAVGTPIAVIDRATEARPGPITYAYLIAGLYEALGAMEARAEAVEARLAALRCAAEWYRTAVANASYISTGDAAQVMQERDDADAALRAALEVQS